MGSPVLAAPRNPRGSPKSSMRTLNYMKNDIIFALVTCSVGIACGATMTAQDGQDAASADKAASPVNTLVLNELLASNQRGRLDEQGQTSDWLELHNAGPDAMRLDGYHLTNDPTQLNKWALPNARVLAGGYLVVSMSGRVVESLSPEALRTSAASIPLESTLVNADAKWKYIVPSEENKDAISGWFEPDFDDRAFKTGKAGFGYGDEDDATNLPEGTTVVLLRHEFTVNEPLASDSLVLQVDYDDGFIAYLNGTRIAAANAPPERLGPGITSRGSHEAGEPERFDLAAHVGLLREGKNILAVAGLNTHPGSSDMSIKPTLGLMPTVSHANFRLSKNGGTLYLVAPDGTVADEIKYPKQLADQTLGRSTETPSRWGYFLTPTPGAPNSGQLLEAPVKSKVAFDPKPGAHEAGVEVSLKDKSSADVDIRFTRDGSEPTASSPLYKEPFRLDKTSVFRTAAFVGKERASEIVSATYLVGDRPQLPVISVTMKPEDFLNVHLTVSASGRSGERPAFMEVFSPNGKRKLATGFGLRLHGGAGRRGGLDRKKSYRTYFRKTYGQGLVDFNLIPEAELKKFDKMVLRSSSNDGRPHGSYIRDQVIRDLHRDMGGLSSAGTWYVLLINGKNFGVYNVCERMDEDFFTDHLGPGQYDVMKTGNTLLSGTADDWNSLRQFISSTDFSIQANYDALAKRVDIENFTAYMIVNLWSQNFDWPHNNWYAARSLPDGKWIFLCWDAEWGFLGGPYDPSEADPYAFIDSGGAYGTSLARAMFFGLLGNNNYREYYQQQVRKHLAGALSTENVMRQIQRHRDAIKFDTRQEFAQHRFDFDRWENQIKRIEEFGRNVGPFFQEKTDLYFAHKPTPSSKNRLAVFEDTAGARHVVYRDSSGELKEMTSAAGTTNWTESQIDPAQKSAGAPTSYSLPGQRHILFRGPQGHIHQLSRADDDAAGSEWEHIDLTEILNQPAAAVDPSVVVANGAPHIVFVDADAKPREFWFEDNKWHHHPLPTGPKPAGEISVTATPDRLMVTYLTAYGIPCQQTLPLRSSSPTYRYWSMRPINLIPGQGVPVSNDIGGTSSVFFRVAEKYPYGEPFVFYHEYRGPGYKGPRDALIRGWDDGTRFFRMDQISKDDEKPASDPLNVRDKKTGRQYVAYRDTNGHIHEGSINQNKWTSTDLVATTKATPAADGLTGFASKSGHRYYVYVGTDGRLHELQLVNDEWNHNTISK